MKNPLVPLMVVGLLLLALGLLYGPRLLREYQFHQAISAMLQHVKDGNIQQTMVFVSRPQRQEATRITSAVLGSGYHTKIRSLKLTSIHWQNDETLSATVTCKVDYSSATAIFQGKLLWRYSQGGWIWDFNESFVAEYAGLEEPAWVKLGEMLSTMESY